MNRNNQPAPNPVTGQTPPRILTVAQVAELLQIPKASVYEKTRTRRGSTPLLPCRRVGKYLRFLESEILGWLMALPQNNLVRRRQKAGAA